MTVKIVGFEVSPGVLSVMMCLHELGVPYQIENPASWQALKDEDFIANKHPFGKIPVLCDGDYTITETRAICRYLVSKYQGKYNDTILIPNDVHKAGLVDQYISYEYSYYTPPVAKLVVEEVFHKTSNPELVETSQKEIDKVLNVYEKLLNGKEYLNGEFSLADVLHISFTHFIFSSTKYADWWNKKPNVKQWWDRISNRDCWKKCVEKIKF
ncbi:glutathione S-transferase [Gigaspora margarita]|uniref:glutathione transferase n=1 Tax=Gigaspora margarita TaxID=4874 RepID=A0A8H4AH02_GIGMA|nr:glutathione S-transferase [Gigaspora margarita]